MTGVSGADTPREEPYVFGPGVRRSFASGEAGLGDRLKTRNRPDGMPYLGSRAQVARGNTSIREPQPNLLEPRACRPQRVSGRVGCVVGTAGVDVVGSPPVAREGRAGAFPANRRSIGEARDSRE